MADEGDAPPPGEESPVPVVEEAAAEAAALPPASSCNLYNALFASLNLNIDARVGAC